MPRAITGAIVRSIRVDPTQAILRGAGRDRWRVLALHAAAALCAAVVVVLLAATSAAASDEVDSLIAEAAAGDDTVRPAAEVVTPVVDSLPGPLAPAVEPITPIVPEAPIGDVVAPVLTVLPHARDVPRRPATSAANVNSAARATMTRPMPADALAWTALVAAPAAGDAAVVASPAPRMSGGPPTPAGSGDPVGPPAPAETGSAGTTLVAVLLGHSNATPTAWSAAAIFADRQPTGLALAPPVPPG